MISLSMLSPVLSGGQSSFLFIPGVWYQAAQAVSSSVRSYMWKLEASVCERVRATLCITPKSEEGESASKQKCFLRSECDISHLVSLLLQMSKLRLVEVPLLVTGTGHTARIFPPRSPLLLISSLLFLP